MEEKPTGGYKLPSSGDLFAVKIGHRVSSGGGVLCILTLF